MKKKIRDFQKCSFQNYNKKYRKVCTNCKNRIKNEIVCFVEIQSQFSIQNAGKICVVPLNKSKNHNKLNFAFEIFLIFAKIKIYQVWILNKTTVYKKEFH